MANTTDDFGLAPRPPELAGPGLRGRSSRVAADEPSAVRTPDGVVVGVGWLVVLAVGDGAPRSIRVKKFQREISGASNIHMKPIKPSPVPPVVDVTAPADVAAPDEERVA